MTFVDLDGYPNFADVPGVEKNYHNHTTGISTCQTSGTNLCCSMDCSGILAQPSSDERFCSISANRTADEIKLQQLNSGASNLLDSFSVSEGIERPGYPSPKATQTTRREPLPHSQIPTLATKRRPRRPRKQNRSCDPCRSAKKACDLPLNVTYQNNLPSSPCSMCRLRGTDCTVSWRLSKELLHKVEGFSSESLTRDQVERGSHATGYTEHAPSPTTTTGLSTPERDLVRDAIAKGLCSQRLDLYIDIFDHPISKLLSETCMPPCYSLGIAALGPLSQDAQFAAQFHQVQSSIKDWWKVDGPLQDPTCASPRLFLSASILDVLLQQALLGCPRVRYRDIALNETYKWVAIATGSQFAVHENDEESSSNSRQHARDISYGTWLKAKNLVFGNISASKSFRLALSLLLFGTVLPPTGTENSDSFQEDAAFALHEGIHRLKVLCTESRAYLQNGKPQSGIQMRRMDKYEPTGDSSPLQEVSTVACKNVMELIAAFEWLVDMSQSVAVTLFPRRSLTVAPPIIISNIDTIHPVEATVQTLDIRESAGYENIKSMNGAIIARVAANVRPVTMLWTEGFPDQVVDSALLESGSLVVLMWRTLAQLTWASADIREGDCTDIQEHFNTMLMLIGLWRTTFGTIDRDTALSLQSLSSDLRRAAIFCATDGDLAVLLFCELTVRLQSQLAEQLRPAANSLCEALRFTRDYCFYERITSALQISYLTSKDHGISSPGLQGRARSKANVEDVRAHPVSEFPLLVGVGPC